jgi:hypothetical protein
MPEKDFTYKGKTKGGSKSQESTVSKSYPECNQYAMGI